MNERPPDGLTLPTFIGIGPGRSGTTFVYEALRAHPEVYMAKSTKETNFFTDEYGRGLAWYGAFFEEGQAARAIGEISNRYFYDEAAAPRMHAAMPGVRLLTCLRNPFDRLRSVYYYRRRAGELPHDMPLEAALHAYADLTDHNRYATCLSRYHAHFGRSQVLIQFFDDLAADPGAFVEALFTFIGVDPTFRPSVLGERVNGSAVARSRWVGALAAAAARGMRRAGLLNVLDRAKRSRLVRRAVLRPVGPEEAALRLSPAAAERLLAAWTPEVRRLEAWTGRDLGHWLDPSRLTQGS